MSIPDDNGPALAIAYALADAGAPLFAGRIDRDGNPDGHNDRRWSAWQKTQGGRRSSVVIDKWREGEALCMLAGVKYDVLDMDPRNGGVASFKKLSSALGNNGPEIYLNVTTPSGGRHFYIEPLGIGTVHGFLPGLDLQGGKSDGSGRGFVFIPPTARPSKWGGDVHAVRPYVPKSDLRPFNGKGGNTGPIKELIEKYIRERNQTAGGVLTGREKVDDLRLKVMAAEAGQQRNALLRYVHEMERKGYDPDDIVRLCASIELQNFDKRRPWTLRDFRGLLHKAGEVIPDATPEELKGFNIIPIRQGLVQSMELAPDQILTWLWEQYLPIGEFVVVDGEKGQGKTFVMDDIVARGSRGDPMPGTSDAIVPKFKSIIFTYEGTAAVKPRLLAANADLTYVFMPQLERTERRGRDPHEDPLALPYGAAMIAKMIREADARLAIFDPIADFLSSEVQTHNDASVRLALRPLGNILAETGTCGVGIRHMNKQKDAGARFRGTGSSAFQNRGRVHLIVGELPELTPEGDRHFAVGMADSNDTKRVGGALAYHITDSDISLDDQGRKVGKVVWEGYVDVDVNTLSRGPSLDDGAGIRGPVPVAQEMAIEVIEELFAESDGYAVPASAVLSALKAAGCSTSPAVLAKVRKRLGISTVREREQEGMTRSWTWVMK